MNTIYWIRHGESTANATKSFSCRVVDSHLTPLGLLQAEQTAAVFKNSNIDFIYSSPLKRAVQTAEIIAKNHRMSVNLIEQFREIDIGDLELQKGTEENWAIYYKTVLKWKLGEPETRFQNGENQLELINRILWGISEAVNNKSNCNIIIVGHGGLLRHTIEQIVKPKIEEKNLNSLKNCSITRLSIKNPGRIDIKIIDWGSSSHLS